MEAYRTHNCGQIRKEDVGKKVKIAGWVQVVRDLGGLVFADIRDQYGITQAVTSGTGELVDIVSHIPNESTVSIEGTVRLRSEDTINPEMVTGEVEVVIEKIEITQGGN